MSGMPRVSVGYRMPPAAAAQLDPLPALTLVHAPRGWGKTSLMASRLSSAGGHGGPVHWVAVGEAPVSGSDVEIYLAQLREVATDPTERPTLVLDGVGELSPDAVGVLLETAEAWDGPNLVLMSRDSRPLVTLAPLAPDSVIITGQHLRLDADRTVEIGRRMGVEISTEHAQRMVDDFAGWPGLVRGALFGEVTGGSGAASYDVLTRLSAHVMTDFSAMTSGGYAGLMLPERITNWVTDELFGGLDASSVVRRVEGLGVVRPDGDAFVFAPGIRRIGMRAFRESHPDHLRGLARKLLERARAEGDVRETLLLATEAGDWAVVRGVVHEHWEALVRDHCDALHSVAVRAPESEVRGDPRLLVGRELLGPGLPPSWMGEFMAARIPASPPAASMGPLPAAGERGIDLLDWRKTLALVAVSRLRAADGVTATIAAHQALKFTPGPDDETPVWASDRAVVAGLSLALTLVGNTTAALEWVRRVERPGDAPDAGEVEGEGRALVGVAGDPATESVVVAGTLARIADELDRLGPVAAGTGRGAEEGATDQADVVRRLLDATTDAGLQGGLVLVLTGIALLRGEAAPMLAEVERRAIVARSATEIPVARILMHSSAADLCLALGHTTAAGSWIDSAHAGAYASVLLEPVRVRLLLARGDVAEVLRRTETIDESVAPRYAIELWLGRAAAAKRSGLLYVLSEAVREAVALAVEHRIVRPFLMLPADVAPDIVELAAPALGDLDVPLLHEHRGVFPAPEDEVRLTARELEVLTELAKGATVPAIARTYVVAPSTIRTHTSALYRKLGVTTRAAAIERAQRLGLLPGTGDDA
ncbi:LuxR C-terminal-related transcriptional regulator [Georgenia sp. Z1344]|uniref:LuxR C-terminal-related transcriptional regulator n=1 Tax=Georgenia sp. Z1344 TaxID=3416706 RepID=UPI003CF5D8CA